MRIPEYLETLRAAELQLAGAFAALAETHNDEPEVRGMCPLLAAWSRRHAGTLQSTAGRHLPQEARLPAIDPPRLSKGPRTGSHGLLQDLHDAWSIAQSVHLRWTVLGQIARALSDSRLEGIASELGGETDRQIAWLRTAITATAPQALIVGP